VGAGLNEECGFSISVNRGTEFRFREMCGLIMRGEQILDDEKQTK
jgi:hypothetical protein